MWPMSRSNKPFFEDESGSPIVGIVVKEVASDGTPTGFTEEQLSGAGWRAIEVNLNADCVGSCKNMQLFYKKWANHVQMNEKDHKSFMNLICLGAIPQKQKVFSRATKGVSEDFF